MDVGSPTPEKGLGGPDWSWCSCSSRSPWLSYDQWDTKEGQLRDFEDRDSQFIFSLWILSWLDEILELVQSSCNSEGKYWEDGASIGEDRAARIPEKQNQGPNSTWGCPAFGIPVWNNSCCLKQLSQRVLLFQAENI